MSKLFKQKER